MNTIKNDGDLCNSPFAISISNPPEYTLFAPSPRKSCISCYFQIIPGRTARPQEHMKTTTFVGGGGGGEGKYSVLCSLLSLGQGKNSQASEKILNIQGG